VLIFTAFAKSIFHITDLLNLLIAAPLLFLLFSDPKLTSYKQPAQSSRWEGKEGGMHLIDLIGPVVSFVVGIFCWWVLKEVAGVPALISTFAAVWIGLAIEIIIFLLIDRFKTNKRISKIAAAIDARISLLERSITRGLFARSLDDPANVWKQVLEDACSAQKSIYVAITVSDFSAPREWDDALSAHLVQWKLDTSLEIPYRVAIFHKKDDLNNEAVQKLLLINNIYRSKHLNSVVHGFIYQSRYFNFSIAIIDSLHVGLLWNSDGGPKSTKGIYFRDAPDLAAELNLWFLHTCQPILNDVRQIAKAN
jgi:hypothetical protein